MHVIVTGASSGLGAAMAMEFSASGADVTVVARREALLEELAGRMTAARADARSHVVTCDLSDPASVSDWVSDAVGALGPVDVLINNAGMQIIGHTAQQDVERGEMLLRLNVHTPMRLTRAVLPSMIDRRSGVIVDVASMAALAPTPGMYYYNASKAALAGASEALRGELLGTGVHVVTVYPGIIPTQMGAEGLQAYESNWALSLQPQGTPEGLATRVRAAVERRRPRVIYPRFNALARWLPGTTRWIMDHLSPPLKD